MPCGERTAGGVRSPGCAGRKRLEIAVFTHRVEYLECVVERSDGEDAKPVRNVVDHLVAVLLGGEEPARARTGRAPHLLTDAADRAHDAVRADRPGARDGLSA